jgi:predicted phosphoribosyltransferase
MQTREVKIPLREAVLEGELSIPAGADRDRRDAGRQGERPRPAVRGRTVLLVDDGLATGITMRTVVVALRQQEPKRIVVAVPVAAVDTCMEFKAEVDEIGRRG